VQREDIDAIMRHEDSTGYVREGERKAGICNVRVKRFEFGSMGDKAVIA